jgi:TorA maturation chaperone TorD
MVITMMSPAMALNLMSNMYLCRPSKEAVENWKRLLADDAAIFMRDLKKAVDEIDAASEQEMEDLLWEYTRLFIGPYKLPCPPWGSVYASPKRLMMQASADAVLDLYREAGLTVNSADVMPDHIGAELNFLAILFQRIGDETENRDHYVKIADKFIREHLMEWTPKFARDMEDAAVSPLYRELAKATARFISFLK